MLGLCKEIQRKVFVKWDKVIPSIPKLHQVTVQEKLKGDLLLKLCQLEINLFV